jgi:hypothetical protein
VVPSGLTVALLKYYGEHSTALLIIVFVVIATAVTLIALAARGLRHEASGPAAVPQATMPDPPRRITYVEFFSSAARELGVEKNSVDAYFLMHTVRQAGADGTIQFYGNYRPYGKTGGMTLQQAAAMTTLDETPR